MIILKKYRINVIETKIECEYLLLSYKKLVIMDFICIKYTIYRSIIH
jgi:hypothetical protein